MSAHRHARHYVGYMIDELRVGCAQRRLSGQLLIEHVLDERKQKEVVSVPVPPTSIASSASRPRNSLALVSFLCGLSFAISAPLALGVTLLSVTLRASAFAALTSGGNAGNQLALAQMLSLLTAAIGMIAFPCLILAIVTGHLALAWAKRRPEAPARRRLAVAGLMIGYSGVALGIIGILVTVFATAGRL
jgi:hypothetical protein